MTRIYLVIFLFTVSASLFQARAKGIPEQPFPVDEAVMAAELGDAGPTEQEKSKKELENKAEVAKEGDEVLSTYHAPGDHQLVGSSRLDLEKLASHKVYYLYGAEHLKLDNYYYDIPVIYNATVKKWIRYFISDGRDLFRRYSERGGKFAPVLSKILSDHGLPRDLIFWAMAESGFQNKAKSWARAVGPWQFMPYTGKKFGLKINWFIDERRDPIKASIAASRYLKKLFQLFDSWELAAAAYNAGEGKMGRAIKKYDTQNFWELTQGEYLKAETKNYVPKIMALAIIGKNLRSFGFYDINFSSPLDFDEIDVPGMSDLMQVAEDLGVPFEEIQRLNPEILRWLAPPYESIYKLRVPVGFKLVWQNCCAQKDYALKNLLTYVLPTKTGLSTVAVKFKIPIDVLGLLNQAQNQRVFPKGHTLLIPFRLGQAFNDPMYDDLHERPIGVERSDKIYNLRVSKSKNRGKALSNPTEFYIVQKGDTLWNVSRKTGVPLDTLIVTNLALVNGRKIREGDKLMIR